MAHTDEGDSEEWSMTVEDGTVTARFSEQSTLDEATATAVQEQFESLVGRSDVTTALTVLETENPLRGGGLAFVEEAASLAAENGVRRWGIVVDEMVKGMAFDSKLDGVETEIFESESAAVEFLDDG